MSSAADPREHHCLICKEDAPYGFGDVRKPETMKWVCARHRDIFDNEVADQVQPPQPPKQGKLL